MVQLKQNEKKYIRNRPSRGKCSRRLRLSADSCMILNICSSISLTRWAPALFFPTLHFIAFSPFFFLHHLRMKRLISPELNNKISTPPVHARCLSTNCYYWRSSGGCCGGSAISHRPLLRLDPEPHACASANVCLRAREYKPSLLISPLRQSHRAEE